MNEHLIVRGRWVLADAATLVADGAVLVAGDTIAEVGPWAELRGRHPEAKVIGSDEAAVLPGLINAHHHSRGVSALQQGVPDLLLESWLLLHARLRPGDPYLDTALSAARLLRSGVTSVVEVHGGRGTPERYAGACRRALEAYDESGIRVAFAAGLRNQGHLVHGKEGDAAFLASLPPDLRAGAEAALPVAGTLDEGDYFGILDDLWRAYEAHPRIDVWFGPPGPPWVSDDFLQAIAARAEVYDCGIQTHVEESLYEKLHGFREYGRATLSHLGDLGVLGPRFSIAHGVWLSEPEVALLAETGAAVSHNPGSNLRLRAGIAPLGAFLAAGATVALGMDGTTLGDDEDMFAEMRLALRLARPPVLGMAAPTPADVFRLATEGGARLLRKEDRLGRLAPGFLADLVVVDLARVCWPWVAPEIEPVDLVVLRARAGDVRTVLVGGRIVLEDGRPTRIDEAAAGRALAERLSGAPHPAEAAAFADRLLPHLETYYRDWKRPRPVPYVAYNSRC